MPDITATDHFFGLGPADWMEARWGDRQAMMARTLVRNDDGSNAGAVEVVSAPDIRKRQVEIEAMEVTIQGTTTPGTRTLTGRHVGQQITLTSVLQVPDEDMPIDPATTKPYPSIFRVPVDVLLPDYQAWASGQAYQVGTPVSYQSHIWRCKQTHNSTNAGATGAPSDSSAYWEPDPRVGRFQFLSPATRQPNPAFGAEALPGIVTWIILTEGEEIFHRILYGMVFRPSVTEE